MVNVKRLTGVTKFIDFTVEMSISFIVTFMLNATVWHNREYSGWIGFTCTKMQLKLTFFS